MVKKFPLVGLGLFVLVLLASCATQIEEEGVDDDAIVERLEVIEEPIEAETEGPDFLAELSDLIDVFTYLNTNHMFENDNEVLVSAAIDAMIRATDDPWINFYSRQAHQQWETFLSSGRTHGIGVLVEEVNGYYIIIDVISNTPAEHEGLLLGDAILSVNGESDFLSMAFLLSEENDHVRLLEIQRGDTIFNMEISSESYYGWLVDGITIDFENQQIGYIRINAFVPGIGTTTGGTARKFIRTLDELEAEGIDGLIIDIRNNSGGVSGQVEAIVNALIPSGRPMLHMVSVDGQEWQGYTGNRLEDYRFNGNMVVLINENSFSASEIFASVMLESGNAELIGTTTGGKGTSQEGLRVGDNILNLSTWEFFSPLGNKVEGHGVTPTIYVETPDFYDFSPVHLGANVVLTYDMVDERIASAQLILDVLGFNVARTDGYFDATTVLALESFQQAQGLTETGTLNSETATALSLRLREKIQDPVYDTQLNRALAWFE